MPVIGNPISNTGVVNSYSPMIKTKNDLKKYILSKLGSPVITVHLTDDQLNYCIDDALELYMQRAYAGNMERYIPISLIQGIRSYTLTYDIFAVLDVHSAEMGGIANNKPANIWSMNQFIAADIYRGTGKIDLLGYEMTNQMLATMNIIFQKKITFDFNCISNELYLYEIPTVAENVMLHVYKKNVPLYDVDGNEITNIYNTQIIRKLASEYARKQWAQNMMLYGGTNMPNGMVLNADAVLNEANTNIEKLELELTEVYSLPAEWAMG